jgi:broad specificity phosphatase PhoE
LLNFKIMRLILTMLVPVVLIASSCSRTVYVVRHAEKETANGNASMMSNNPQLSEAGKVRAIVLRDELKSKRVAFIFSTNTIRTITTAKPLSDQTGIPVQLYNTTDSLDYLIRSVKAMKKGNVLIVGHSNTVDDVVNKLCGEIKITGDLADIEYDNLFIVKLKGKKAKFVKKKYGYPSNPEK